MTTPTTDVDVLVVGAGISGIGIAYHLKTRRPATSFVVLDGRAEIGGTWSLHKYPGIRSDSDMPTFGFGFKPWTDRKSIADGHIILNYLREVVEENGLAGHMRFGYQVRSAEFSSPDAAWTVTAEHAGQSVQFRARWLFLGTGYYDYEQPFIPEFAGVDEFEGPVIHPQHWPEQLDYAGKRVVVIGSGATAVTLIPAMADSTSHITMLQRSPSYVLSLPASDPLANVLNRVLGHDRAYKIIRRKNILLSRTVFKACMRFPTLMRRLLIANVARQLPKGFDVDTHFSPRYNPWEQRLAMVPDGDLFKCFSSGRASVVTDRISRFTKTGIRLESGQELAADIIVTATGLNMSPFGKITLHVDGAPVHLPDTVAYKAMMLSGVPNLAFALGYTNIAWTLKVDLVCEHFCRLLDHMDAQGYDTVVPILDDPVMERLPLMDMSSGYVQRAIAKFPRSGTRGPWQVRHAYEVDVARLREGPVRDGALRFAISTAPTPASRPGSRHR